VTGLSCDAAAEATAAEMDRCERAFNPLRRALHRIDFSQLTLGTRGHRMGYFGHALPSDRLLACTREKLRPK